MQEVIGSLQSLLGKLENIEHTIAAKVKAELGGIINDIKEHI